MQTVLEYLTLAAKRLDGDTLITDILDSCGSVGKHEGTGGATGRRAGAGRCRAAVAVTECQSVAPRGHCSLQSAGPRHRRAATRARVLHMQAMPGVPV